VVPLKPQRGTRGNFASGIIVIQQHPPVLLFDSDWQDEQSPAVNLGGNRPGSGLVLKGAYLQHITIEPEGRSLGLPIQGAYLQRHQHHQNQRQGISPAQNRALS